MTNHEYVLYMPGLEKYRKDLEDPDLYLAYLDGISDVLEALKGVVFKQGAFGLPQLIYDLSKATSQDIQAFKRELRDKQTDEQTQEQEDPKDGS